MLRRAALVGLLAAALVPASARAGVVADQFPNGSTAFQYPTFVTAPPGDTHRVFIVEQPGTIELVKDGGAPTTFLDISGRVNFDHGEQGLLSMAFAPDYATSGRFYVYYTSTHCLNLPGCDEHVSEFTLSNLDQGNPLSENVLLTIPHPNQENHNGGQLQFGADGNLYVSTGDGGGANDTEGNAQRTDVLLGKILRIHPDGGSAYSIPSGNPFSGALCATGPHSGSPCPEIWNFGLRNPWRFSFDFATGDMVIGDVGQDSWEELDFAPGGRNAGANYGWPCFEGTHDGSPSVASECPPRTPVVGPILEYPHPSNCSGAPYCGSGVIGGYVLHDPSLPSLAGCYVYGDLATPDLRYARLTQSGVLGDANLGPHVSDLSSFGVDASGHLYAASIDGPVYRLDSDGNAATTPTCPQVSGPPPPPDKTPPTLKLRFSRRQRILKTHFIKLVVVVNERSTLAATGTVNVGRAARVLRFKRIRRIVAPNKRITLKLRLSKSNFAKLRRALRHRKSFVARVTVSARDAAGNSRAKRVRIRLVR